MRNVGTGPSVGGAHSHVVDVAAAVMWYFFFQAEDGIRDYKVTGVQTCALPIYLEPSACRLQEIDKLGRHAVDSNSLFIDQLRVHRDDLIGQEGEGFYHLLDGIKDRKSVV